MAALFCIAASGLNGVQLSRMPASRVLRSVTRSVSRFVSSPRMVTLEESGEFGTTDFTMTFKDGDKVLSPWHDMPLELEGGLYNMLTEIPKMTFKKMEVDTKSPGNPIKQDEKKGKARLYHGPIFWNYGCLPQTWEDPNVKGDEDVGGAFGDDDPVDARASPGSNRRAIRAPFTHRPRTVRACRDARHARHTSRAAACRRHLVRRLSRLARPRSRWARSRRSRCSDASR
jgi:hypothetical protein